MKVKRSVARKLTGSHSTLNSVARQIVKDVERCALITKVTLGYISQRGGGNGVMRIKIHPIGAGLRIACLSDGSAQDVYVYTAQPDQATNFIREACGSEGVRCQCA